MSNEEQGKSDLPSPGPIAWMAQNTVAANLLMIIFLVGGLLLSTQVKQEVFPEFTTDIVRISVPYPGASPEEVEQGVVLSIEDGVRGLEGVKRVTSVAAEGAGTIIAELLTSADPFKVVQDIKNEVDRITSFPEDAERPVVSLVESRRRVVSLLVHGKQERKELRDLAERIRDELIQTKGVTLVELGLSPGLEIAIEIPDALLREHQLTLEQVAQVVRQSALELPGGEVRTAAGRVLLRTAERRDLGAEFEDIIVKTASDGTVVRLSDIASIIDGFRETDQEASFNGDPAIFVEIYRVGNETPQSVSAAVNSYIEKLQDELPQNVGLTVWRDQSLVYQDRMFLLLKNAMLGLTLVLILLGLFLEIRLAFWVTLGIPISILGCFLFLPLTGASINMISLFAFIITLGIIVDDAVVTGENIYEKHERGLDPLNGAIVGAREISMPVVFAVLTNVVAFLPLFFVPGVSGKFFRQIPAVVVAVFLVSLVESLFVLPAHLAHPRKDRKIWRILNAPREWCNVRLQKFIQTSYSRAVARAVQYRYCTFAIAVAVLLSARALVVGGHLSFSFMPKIDADLITAQATLPFGVSLKESHKIEGFLVDAAKRAIKSEDPSIAKGIYSQVGGTMLQFGPGPKPLGGAGGSHIVAAQVSLVSSELREISGEEFARLWRKQVGEVIGLESLVFKYSTGASEGAAIELNLSHRSREVTERAAFEIAQELRTFQGVTDIDDGVANGKPQLSFQITEAGRSLGVTSREIGRQLRSAFFGSEALRQQRGRNEVKVMVRLPRTEREQMETVENMIIRTPGGGEIPLLDAAEVETGRSYTEINRRNGNRVIAVTAEVDNSVTSAGKVISAILTKKMPELQKKYPGLTNSFGGEKEAQDETLRALGIGFLIAMLAIYALLAIPFRSYVQPLIVMLSIPFGIIGAVAGHYLLGYGLSIISMFGVIALSGVVVNDSLVLVVTANRLRAEGASAYDAIQRAGMRRFRPILLTSLTTFFGLAPMIFETSMQARFLIPMAISLGFGILFATVIILLIVPAVYIILHDVQTHIFVGALKEAGQRVVGAFRERDLSVSRETSR